MADRRLNLYGLRLILSWGDQEKYIPVIFPTEKTMATSAVTAKTIATFSPTEKTIATSSVTAKTIVTVAGSEKTIT